VAFLSGEGQVLNDIFPLCRISCLGNQLQILYVAPDCRSQLIAECQASESLTLPLPFLSQGLESDILRKNNATEIGSALEQISVPHFAGTIVLGSQYVDTAKAKLVVDRFVHVNIEIK
jgi:hypothetical protein